MSELCNCHDCGAKPGEYHQPGCDTEPCPFCGGQLISCGCVYERTYPAEFARGGMDALPPDVIANGLPPDKEAAWDALLREHGLIPWSGEWPGAAECREFGWFAKFVPRVGWVPCAEHEPGASPDLNRLHGLSGEARWDATAKRWVRRV